MKNILNNIDALVYAIQYHDYKIIKSNRMLLVLFPDFKVGDTCYKTIFGRDSVCEKCPMKLQENKNVSASETLWTDVLKKWFRFEYNDYIEKDGSHLCICTGVDITEVKASISVTEIVLNGIQAAAYMVGVGDYKLLSINQELRNMLPNIKEGDLCYKALWDNSKPCPHCPIPKLSTENPYGKLEIFNQKLSRYLSIDSTLVEMNEKSVVIFTGYDNTDRIEYENRLKNLVYNDLQLNIKNRSAFMNDLDLIFEKSEIGYVFILSIKNFSNYNLTYGGADGDVLLKQLAQYYIEYYGKDRCFRVGGAKFAFIALTKIDYEKLCKFIQMEIPQTVLGSNKIFHLFVDTVIIEFPCFASNPETIMHNAEYMFQKTKKIDSNRIMLFQKTELEQLGRKNQITALIRNHLEKEKFQVYYQPIYDIIKQDFVKCEALLRLYDSNLGWISPTEFIPLAEDSGLINDLGMFVLDKACRFIDKRKKEGLKPIQVNVNVSTIQFSKDSFYEDVLEVIGKYDIDIHLIQLEVTESIVINSFETIIKIMRRLINCGISFAVDDFGTGYSSLSYIGSLPAECIKLDKSFIDHIAKSEIFLLIVKNIIEIAKGLRFKIVAEGVERQDQFELLKKLGCDYIQGYLFSKPLDEESYLQFLNNKEI